MKPFPVGKLAAAGLATLALSAWQIVGTGHTLPHAYAAAPAAKRTVDEKKLAVAEHLTDWMQNTLLSEKAIVAVVSRKGGKDVKSRDFTGMAHSGLAVYDPRAQTWILYQILNCPENGAPKAVLWKSAPSDFFYGQTGYDENALVLIPDSETQTRIYNGIISGKAFKLAFTTKYNLLTQYDSPDSLNCNKWILMTVAAARSDDYNPYDVLQVIHKGFDPAKLKLGFLARGIVKHKSNVLTAELPQHGPVETVTPQSLYDSGLFQTKLFTHPVSTN
ncbi:MAG TPA: DUF2145 domain-containing protein [Trichormus sp.]|jgi:hypothetical protein